MKEWILLFEQFLKTKEERLPLDRFTIESLLRAIKIKEKS